MKDILENLPVGSGVVSLDGTFLWGSGRLRKELLLTPDDPLDFTFQDITFSADLDEDLKNVEKLISGRAKRYSMEKRYVFGDDAPFWVDLDVALQRDASGAPEQYVVCIKNIDERKTLERRVNKLAYQDPLTGLANRTAFLEYAEERVDNRAGQFTCVGIVDLNNLKYINDTHGHLAGNRAICAIGDGLRTIVGDDGLVARLGGDEFGIILNKASRRIVRLSQAGQFERTISVGEDRIRVTAAVGFSGFMNRQNDISQLLAQADARMYECKGLLKAGSLYGQEQQQAQGASGVLAYGGGRLQK